MGLKKIYFLGCLRQLPQVIGSWADRVFHYIFWSTEHFRQAQCRLDEIRFERFVHSKRMSLHPLIRKSLFMVATLSIGLPSFAQDYHFSQLNNTPLAVNPALTGGFEADIRAMTNYKNQWTSFDPSFRTISGAVDMKFDLSNTSMFGTGLYYYNDKSGNIDFGLSYVGLSGAYGTKLSKKLYLSGGIQLAFGQRSAKIENLRWDSQYNGFFYDANLPTNESIGSNQKSFF
jgi:type IX secretion system PorP/SprF family membrane protein